MTTEPCKGPSTLQTPQNKDKGIGQRIGRRTPDLRSGAQILVPFATSGAVTLGKSLSLSRPQFPHLQDDSDVLG